MRTVIRVYVSCAILALALPLAARGAAGQKPAGWLGIGIEPVPPTLAEHLGLKVGEGVLVSTVIDDGPAAKAGLAEYDILFDLGDGQTIQGPEDLVAKVSARAPGEKVNLSIVRKGKRSTVAAELGVRPAAPERGPGFRADPRLPDGDSGIVPGLPGGGAQGWYRMFRSSPGGAPFQTESHANVYISSTRDGKTVEITGRDGQYTVTRRETSDGDRSEKVITKEYPDVESLKGDDPEAAELLGKVGTGAGPELPEEWRRFREYLRDQGGTFEDDEFMQDIREMEEQIRERLRRLERHPAARPPAGVM